MATLIPYLVFSGNCKMAMTFYADILRGDITTMVSFGDSPIKVAPELQERIFDAELRAGEVRFKASDDLPEHQVKQGTHISMFLAFSDPIERKRIFSALSENGKVLFPLNDYFGMLQDQFGIQWMMVNEEN